MSALTLKFSLVFIISVAAQSSFAGKHDFNALIDENIQVQKQLAEKLQNQLGTDKVKNESPDFTAVGKEVVGKTTENHAVETKDKKVSRKSSKDLELEKKNFKRLSQEFKGIR